MKASNIIILLTSIVILSLLTVYASANSDEQKIKEGIETMGITVHNVTIDKDGVTVSYECCPDGQDAAAITQDWFRMGAIVIAYAEPKQQMIRIRPVIMGVPIYEAQIDNRDLILFLNGNISYSTLFLSVKYVDVEYVSPTNIAPPTYPSTPSCTGTSTYAYIESRTMEKGKEVRIPVMMCNANDLANMDFSVSYDPKVLRFKDAEKGSLNSNFLFESNEISSGNVKISFASSKGVSGSGSIAILTFDVVGSNGDSSILTGSVNTADTSSGSPIGLTINPGEFTVGPSAPGDCDGDGIVTSRDALAALQMSVGKIKVDLCYDVTGDGKVSSDDARDILKKAVKL